MKKEKGRRPRALFFGSSRSRRMSSSRPGRRRPPPALRRGVGANAAARAEQKELWRRVPNSFSIVGAPGAGPRLCWEGRWRAWARGRPLGRVAGAARGAVARLPRQGGKGAWPAPEPPHRCHWCRWHPFWAPKGGRGGPKVSGPQGGSRPRSFHGPILTRGDTNSPSLDHSTYWREENA